MNEFDIIAKTTPNDIETEKTIIGSLMLDKTAFDRCNLKPEHFYNDANATIFTACMSLNQANSPMEIMSLVPELQKMGKLEEIGGFPYLAKVAEKVTSTANVEYYSALLIEKYNLREIIRITSQAISDCYKTSADPFEVQAKIFNELEKTQFRSSREPVKLSEVATENIIKLDKIQKADNYITGINTGFIKINENTHGWHSPDLIILAARPSTGKTAFALNIAYNVIIQDIPVAFFSLEMSKSQLVNRLISLSSGVFANKLRNADLDKYDWERIHAQRYNMPLYIDDTPALSLVEFKAKARKLKRKNGIKMIVIDYLQLMVANVKGNREQEISTISRNLKAMAKELDIPIIALAQLSRDVEKRSGKPRLSDLRESGAIEQDADIIIFLHDNNPDDKTITKPLLSAIWAKHRDGACVEIDMEFDKPIQKFKDAPRY